MYKLQNTKTGKSVKDAISGKPFTFKSEDDARIFGDSMHRDYVLSATAWNRKRGFSYVVVKA